jgi:hypothetical protein
MARRETRNTKILALDGAKTRLSANPDGTLRVVHGGKTWKSVRVRLGRPLYKPLEFAALFDLKGKDRGLLTNIPGLNSASRRVLNEHQHQFNLTCQILRVHSLSHQFGAAYWDVSTNKGHRQFVIRGTTEHVRWLSDDRMLIKDVQGNRFEIPRISALDKKSQDLIHLIL